MYNFSLPIEIGCKVYRVHEGFQRAVGVSFRWEADKVEEGKVSMLQQKADKSWKFRTPWGDFALSDLGKEIFLTEEDANTAMLAMQKKRSEAALNGK